MLFRNLCLYRLPADWAVTATELEERLEGRPLTPCGTFDMKSRGWEPVMNTHRPVLTVENQHLIAFGMEQKLLPGAVVRQTLEKRMKEVAEEQGFPVGRKQKRDLKLAVTEELRAKAMVTRRITHAWIDTVNRWLVVDTGSTARAEEVITMLRETLGTFAVTPLDTMSSPATTMGTWLMAGEAAYNFQIDEDLELKAIDGSGGKIRYSKHAFDLEEVRTHLKQGFTAARMLLTWNGRVSFALTDKLQLKGMQFLELAEVAEDAEENQEAADPIEQLSAEFLLMTGELAKLFTDLVGALGGEPEQTEAAPLAAAA